MKLAVTIICKDNERTIENTLRASRLIIDRLGGSGTIIAFDSGSKDSTLQLLSHYGAQVINCEWQGYLKTIQAALRFTEAEMRGSGWILCLDSDESPDGEMADAIIDLIQRDPSSIHGACVNRRVRIWGRLLKRTWQPEWRLRLIRTGAADWVGRDPHYSLQLRSDGQVVRLPGMVEHDTFFGFSTMLNKTVQYGRIAGEAAYADGARTSAARVVASPVFAFVKHYFIKAGFVDGYAGFLAAASTAAYTLLKHIVWLELQLGRSDKTISKDQ